MSSLTPSTIGLTIASQAALMQSVMSSDIALPSIEKSTTTGSAGSSPGTNECDSFQRRAISLVICAPAYLRWISSMIRESI